MFPLDRAPAKRMVIALVLVAPACLLIEIIANENEMRPDDPQYNPARSRSLLTGLSGEIEKGDTLPNLLHQPGQLEVLQRRPTKVAVGLVDRTEDELVGIFRCDEWNDLQLDVVWSQKLREVRDYRGEIRLFVGRNRQDCVCHG